MYRVVTGGRGLLLIWWASSCFAGVWRVPEQVVSIQAALDSTADRDTVSVAIGEYAEALITPPHFVYLIGDTVTLDDSLHRPVLDPAALDSSTNLSCLTIPLGSSVSIEYFAIRNGQQMYPRDRPGGIVYRSNDSIVVRSSLFDSVYHGFFPGNAQVRPRFVIEQCEFLDMRYSCGNLRGPAQIRECLIHGDCVSGFGVFDSSIVERCHFTGSIEFFWIDTYRHNTTIRDNVFGPGTYNTAAVEIISRQGADSVIGNVFNRSSIPQTSGESIRIYAGDGPPVVVWRNVITDTTGGTAPLTISSRDISELVSEDMEVRIIENSIMSALSESPCKAIKIDNIYASVSVSRNRIQDIAGSGAAIAVDSNAYRHTFRENIFQNTGSACYNASSFTLDVRRNWWGHETGPYHPQLNPSGQGDMLSGTGSFDIEPWLTDTSLWSGITHEPQNSPAEYQLTAFPNPTNATLSVLLTSPRQTEAELKLFNILGREVMTLWSGSIDGFARWDFDLEDRTTGIYFLRAVDGQKKTLATQKIVLLN